MINFELQQKSWKVVIFGLLCLATGCGKGIRPGQTFAYPGNGDQAVFSVSGTAVTTMTNRHGIPIQGLILTDVSLIRSAADLKESKRRHYVVFQDFLLGNLTRGRYWQQQAEKKIGLGLPVMDTRSTKVTLIEVASDDRIKEVKNVRAAHVQISVDTNDFSRQFEP